MYSTEYVQVLEQKIEDQTAKIEQKNLIILFLAVMIIAIVSGISYIIITIDRSDDQLDTYTNEPEVLYVHHLTDKTHHQ